MTSVQITTLFNKVCQAITLTFNYLSLKWNYDSCRSTTRRTARMQMIKVMDEAVLQLRTRLGWRRSYDEMVLTWQLRQLMARARPAAVSTVACIATHHQCTDHLTVLGLISTFCQHITTSAHKSTLYIYFVSVFLLSFCPFLPFPVPFSSPFRSPRSGRSNTAKGFEGALLASCAEGERHLQPADTF